MGFPQKSMSARPRFVTVAGLGAVVLGAAALLWLLPALLGLAGGTVPEVATVLASAGRPPVPLHRTLPGLPGPAAPRSPDEMVSDWAPWPP